MTIVWISLYFVANLALTLHNKWVLSKIDFGFPWLLTALHVGVSGLGSFMLSTRLSIPTKTLDEWSDLSVLVQFSLLYTTNIAVSNISLNHVSLSFHQIVRSLNPVFTLAFERLCLDKTHAPTMYWSLVPVVIGVCLTTLGESIQFTAFGISLAFLGVFLASLKGVITNVLLQGSHSFHPLDLMWRTAPLCVFQCILCSYLAGEPREAAQLLGNSDPHLYEALLLNGVLAFLLNWISFVANKNTSALTMTVAGNVKQVALVALGIHLFSTPVTAWNLCGIITTLLGGMWYSMVSYTIRSGGSKVPV